jgi:hypothetical protein
MRRAELFFALFLALTLGAAGAAARTQPAPTPQATGGEQAAAVQPPVPTMMRATVRRVLTPHVFTLDDRLAADGESVVVAPGVEVPPVPGTTVLATGMLRPGREIVRGRTRGWDEIDESTRAAFASRPILIATTLRAETNAGAQAPPATAGRRDVPARVRPVVLGELIDDLGGQRVTLLQASVVSVINPSMFVVEPANPLRYWLTTRHRMLVAIDAGALRVDAAALVRVKVTVNGVARTPLGLQLTREVPWPPALTRDALERDDIRAVVLATSVQTADGVELTNRAVPTTPPTP